MSERIRALLVQAKHDPLGALPRALKEESIEIVNAGSCAEAASVLWTACPPHIVFTEVQFADGGWADVLALAAMASAHVNVIVLAPFVDVGFYVETIERGAFDFMVAPHSDPELLHVIRTAAENAVSRRKRAAGIPAVALMAHSRTAGEICGQS